MRLAKPPFSPARCPRCRSETRPHDRFSSPRRPCLAEELGRYSRLSFRSHWGGADAIIVGPNAGECGFLLCILATLAGAHYESVGETCPGQPGFPKCSIAVHRDTVLEWFLSLKGVSCFYDYQMYCFPKDTLLLLKIKSLLCKQ